MPINILMPALSPTMTEGNLAKWLKKEGDKVKTGDVIAEIETDKATMEVESIDEGVMGKIIVGEGTENVKVNELIAVLLQDGETMDNISIPTSVTTEKKQDENIVLEKPKAENADATTKKDNLVGEKLFISPLAKRIAENSKLDVSKINGSGPHGRIIKSDVEKFANQNQNSQSGANKDNYCTARNPIEYSEIKNNNMRKVIAKRLLLSKQTIPHFYLSVECNLDKLLQLREEINHSAEHSNLGFKLSVNDFIIKASALSLRDVPEVNSSWTDEAVLMYNNVDIAVAVAIDGGLITPIIKNADHKSLSAISNEMKDLAKRAKENSLAPEEFQGGGFSISNLGMYGIKKFEAIINPPQSAILACGAASKRPIVENDNVKIATICDFSLSCDHRIVDGAVGARFLKSFKKYIESPILIFT